MKKLGLVVNPIAGMGGTVGLKGTDGKEIIAKAREMGAEAKAPFRTITALEKLKRIEDEFKVLTYQGVMGEWEVKQVGLNYELIGRPEKKITSAFDTVNAAKELKKRGVNLLLFVGGDGTARDIYQAVGNKQVVLGIPAGVKIHSGVYATNPIRAGELAVDYIQDKIAEIREMEVMDIDESAFREGTVKTKLYGYLKIPFARKMVQKQKSGSSINDRAEQELIAVHIINEMEKDFYYIIGPGTTTRPIMQQLDLDYSLLGVDIIYNKKLIAQDLSEKEILNIIEGEKVKIIVTPIGGQGHLFGRGNQQFRPVVIREVGLDNIIIVATEGKINSFQGRPLLVDTGDKKLNNDLKGYFTIVSSYNRKVIYKVDY